MKTKKAPSKKDDFLKRIPKATKEFLFKPNVYLRKGRGVESGVIVNLNTGRYYTINPTGEKIWLAINGKRTVYIIAGMIAKHFSVPKDRVLQDVLSVMQTFEKAGLIRWQVKR
ncbi:MAG: hypothetical protein UV78_C0014G0016 [Parcubacteria group bacterium GW2011_GWA2_43_17]|nr:MAG: hypothetical protein UV78_C0014G0016 [Parcubacteria group bacterium GW2011_GWA2_43_17]